MYESTHDAAWMHSIDLAQEADFNLGSLRVRPGRCEVEFDGVSRTLQRRVMQVLVALAHARGAVVSQDDLVVRCWRGLSVSEDAICRCISKLRKLAADYPGSLYLIEAVPGVGYRLTCSDSATDEQIARRTALHDRRRRFGAMAAAAVLFLIVAVAAASWILPTRDPAHRPVRVAVQPFESLGDPAETRSLARRIPNEVVNALGDSQIEAVLAGEQAGIGTAGSAFRVPGLIVTGIVRDDDGNKVVDVRIEDGRSHAALWSTEFKRAGREASDLPLEVAARVADVVNMVNFARTANPPLTDDSALTPLLQTADMIRDARDGAWAPMVESAQGLVARHPEFAFGHSVLAAAYAEAASGITVPDRAQAMSEAARREARLTLKLDPEDAGAYAVLAGLEPDYAAREATLLRGIRLAKHPKEPLGALYSYEGVLLESVGRLREALSYQLIAQATDRWGAPKAAKVALIYAKMGNLPAARNWISYAVQRWPNHSGVRSARLTVTALYEQPSDALAMIDKIDAQTSVDDNRNDIWRRFVAARSAHSAQLTGTTIRKISEAAEKRAISRETEIMMLAELGEPKAAMAVANRALDHRQRLDPRFFLFTPVTRNIRQDPGFITLASRLGLIGYWRQTGTRPDFCTGAAARDECGPQLLALLNSR